MTLNRATSSEKVGTENMSFFFCRVGCFPKFTVNLHLAIQMIYFQLLRLECVNSSQHIDTIMSLSVHLCLLICICVNQVKYTTENCAYVN